MPPWDVAGLPGQGGDGSAARRPAYRGGVFGGPRGRSSAAPGVPAQKPGALARRLGLWPVPLLAGLALAASRLVLGQIAGVVTAALMLAANSAAWLCSE